MGKLTEGKRIFPNEDGHLILAAGDYGKDLRGVWMARCPDPEISMGSLESHDVVEHEDGSISVTPSILIQYPYGDQQIVKRWHGFLEKGIWRED